MGEAFNIAYIFNGNDKTGLKLQLGKYNNNNDWKSKIIYSVNHENKINI